MRKFKCLVKFIALASFFLIINVAYADGLPVVAPFLPYEKGDIVIFGETGTSKEHPGHSAILGPREFKDGVWKVQIIDCMPGTGASVHNQIYPWPIEKILTSATLLSGKWSERKENLRNQILNTASNVARTNPKYIIGAPPKTSDIAFSYINPLITTFMGEDYVIQPDSIFANPPGTHNYFPRQKGAEVNRYTCNGFTEHVYELCGLDIVSSCVEYQEYSYPLISWIEIPGVNILQRGRAYAFWPLNQKNEGCASSPRGPEVKITAPKNDAIFNKDTVTLTGEAKDVSEILRDKFYFSHTSSDNLSAIKDVSVNSSHAFSCNFSNLIDGFHRFSVIAYDKAGNLSNKFDDGTSEFKFLIDTVPPFPATKLASSRQFAAWSNISKITTTWQAAEDDTAYVDNPADVSGIAGYGVVWNTAATSLPPEQKTIDAVTSTANETPLPDGKSHYFHIRSVDKAGNWGKDAASIGPFWIDATAPNITITILWEEKDNKGQYTTGRCFRVDVSDPIVNDAI